MSTPDVLRVGNALLLQGAALHDVARLVVRGLRHQAHTDGSPPSARQRHLLELLNRAVSAGPVSDVRTLPGRAPSSWIGSAAAADLLGVTPRQVRRLASELGATRCNGRWFLDRGAVLDLAERRQAREERPT